MLKEREATEQPIWTGEAARQLPRVIGETTITGRNQITLPAEGLRRVGWKRGDRLIVQLVYGDMILLMRRPDNWADAFAGKLSDVFGSHEDTIAYLEEERRSWDDE